MSAAVGRGWRRPGVLLACWGWDWPVYVVLVVVVTGGSMASVDGWVLVSVLGVLVT